jgi:hypothetical protein
MGMPNDEVMPMIAQQHSVLARTGHIISEGGVADARARAHPRRTASADRRSQIVCVAVPWLCLLLVECSLALVCELAVGALQPNIGNASVPEATPAQCHTESEKFLADVLVTMTTEDLRYLESTLCPSSSGARSTDP